MIIDTAGVRKVGKMKDDVEYYGYTRATRSVRRADVVLFMMDATTKISQVDKKR
jgi:GTP-binding protein